MKKVFCFFLIISFFVSPFFAQSNFAPAANRRTATRFLRLSEEYLAKKLWDSAYSQAQMGLNYDSSISDLWYISAASLHGQKKQSASVLPLVQKSLDLNNWISYNKEPARVLYAELLSLTGEYQKAISILDAAPFLYSSDAEYIRSKSLYKMNTPSSLENARSKINSARRIYPNDTRFAHLFFKYEYPRKENPLPENVRQIAEAFIQKMPTYDNPDAELEIYAAIFSDANLKERALRAFTAHNMEHPLYAKEAVLQGLLSEFDAIEYFFKFANESIPLDWLTDFTSCIKGKSETSLLREHLASFHGLLKIDATGDLEDNIFVQYTRGRPEIISYDKDNDGVFEWSVLCDFGVPLSVNFDKMNFTYGTYPYIVNVSQRQNKFSFANESFSFSPFTLVAEKRIKQIVKTDFFIPSLNKNISLPTIDSFSKIANRMELPTQERKNAHIVFSVVDGVYQSAEYYEGNVLYARASFENGIPFMRLVDNDGDGVFETTELYSIDKNNSFSQGSKQKTNELIFGTLENKMHNIYTSAIHIDENADTISDFIEEYTSSGGIIRYWDTTGDRKWNIRYERQAQKENEALVEVASFYTVPDKKYVSVTTYDKKPGKVLIDQKEVPVYKGRYQNLYWLNEVGSVEEEALVLSHLNKEKSQGFSMLIQSEHNRLLAVRVAEFYYVSIMPPAEENPDGEQ